MTINFDRAPGLNALHASILKEIPREIVKSWVDNSVKLLYDKLAPEVSTV